jgi:crossover junction endodeoxyribonuclease RusA
MKQLKIVGPIPPSVNNYLNYRVQTKNKRRFVQAYKSEASLIFENIFLKISEEAAREQAWVKPTPEKYIIVECTFYFPRHGMDSNNHYKLPLDVLKSAGIYHDDSKVIERTKRIYIDSKDPKIELIIYESNYVGIFDSERELEVFKFKNCINCSKNHEKCSIFKGALENRLTGDINLDYNNCNKIKPRKK